MKDSEGPLGFGGDKLSRQAMFYNAQYILSRYTGNLFVAWHNCWIFGHVVLYCRTHRTFLLYYVFVSYLVPEFSQFCLPTSNAQIDERVGGVHNPRLPALTCMEL